MFRLFPARCLGGLFRYYTPTPAAPGPFRGSPPPSLSEADPAKGLTPWASLERGLRAGLSPCRFSGPQVVSSGRGLRDPRPVPHGAEGDGGPPSAALPSDFWKAFGDMFLPHQLCINNATWPAALPGNGHVLWGLFDPWLVVGGSWAVLRDAVLRGSLGMGARASPWAEAGGLRLQLAGREAPCGQTVGMGLSISAALAAPGGATWWGTRWAPSLHVLDGEL